MDVVLRSYKCFCQYKLFKFFIWFLDINREVNEEQFHF